MINKTSFYFKAEYEKSFKTGESLIATQRDFRAHFMLRRNNAVPDKIFNP